MILRGFKGASVRGALRYATDDRPETDRGPDEEGKPRGRVAWTVVLNMKGIDNSQTELAGCVMQGTIYDAPTLKRLSGNRAGRPLQHPCYHLVAAFHETEFSVADVHLRKQDILNDLTEMFSEFGITKHHQVVLVAHVDKGHLHVHAIVNRVDPRTGMALDLTDDRPRLSAIAGEYEKSRGRIVCPARIARQERRALPPAERGPVPYSAPRIGPGREPRTPYETKRWAQLFEKHEKLGTPPAEFKAAKAELRAELDLRRARRDRVTTAVSAITQVFRRAEKVEGTAAPALRRRRSHPRTPSPARHATPIDATAEPRSRRSEAAAPRPPLRERVDRAIRNEDRREKRRLARQAREQLAEQAAAREAAAREERARAATEAHHTAVLAARAERIAREEQQHAAAQSAAGPAAKPRRRAQPQPAAAPAPTHQPTMLERMQAANDAEDRRRARLSPTGDPTAPLPTERITPIEVDTAPTRKRRPQPAQETTTPKTPTPTPKKGPTPRKPATRKPATRKRTLRAPAAPKPAPPRAAGAAPAVPTPIPTVRRE